MPRIALPAFLFAALLSLCSAEFAEAKRAQPNLIVVFCDNLGYGDIEPFGSQLHRTPNLNRMAKEGRRFTHFCVTAGVCTPSRASLMTGCYSQRVGMHLNSRDGQVLRPISPYGLHPDEVTIAEVLKQQGYATAIIGKWHLGDQLEFLPTRQGFDWFFGVPYSDDMTRAVGQRIGKRLDGERWPPLPLMENETVIEAPCDRDGLTKRYTERAVEWIGQHRDRPFFLYMPQAMPGSTRTPFASPAFRGKSNNGPWGDSIEELDWSLGVILDKLVEFKIAEDTLVVWTSDNGAPLNSDTTDLSRGSNLPLHGRGYTTSEGAFRVPTIVWQPGSVPANTTCDELASTMDLLPTFAKLAGGGAARERRIDGRDIRPLLFGEPNAKSPHEAYYYYYQDQLHAVRSGPWKLFLPVASTRHPHYPPKGKREPLLFHLFDDVGCRKNVASEHADVVAKLMRLAETAREDLGDKGRAGRGQRQPGKATAKPTPRLLPAKPKSTSKHTNILLITADNLGYGDLACYNSKSNIKTPHIDVLATQGARLTNFYTASPTCTVSRACLLTGRIPQRHGLLNQLSGVKGNYGVGLNHAEVLLPEILQQGAAPYATGCFGKWNIGFAKGSRPTERGFDEFIGNASGNLDYYRHNYREMHDLYRGVEPLRREGEYVTDIIADGAIEFMRRHSRADRPWFCYLPFNAPHFPVAGNKRPGEPNVWQAPRRALAAYGFAHDEADPRKRYAAVVTALDEALGRVLGSLDELGVAENTFVFFYSDNGAFRLGRAGIDVGLNTPLRHGGVTCWEGGLRVAAIARWPGEIQPGSRVDQVCWSPDLLVTCAAIAGAKPPADRPLDGENILPLLKNKQARSPHRSLYFSFRNHAALRKGVWKIVRERPNNPWQLYDLSTDIGESRDLAKQFPDRVAELAKEWAEWE